MFFAFERNALPFVMLLHQTNNFDFIAAHKNNTSIIFMLAYLLFKSSQNYLFGKCTVLNTALCETVAAANSHTIRGAKGS